MKNIVYLFLLLLFVFTFSFSLQKQEDLGTIFDNIDVDAGVSIKIFPDKWHYGTIIEECESPSFPFVVTNDGGLPVYIRKSYIDGDDKKHFVIKEDNCKDKILAVGDTCTIEVAFKPKDEGNREAELIVRYYGNKNIEDFIKDLIKSDYREEKADLEGVGLPSPTGDFIDYENFCPDYPDYELPKDIEDRGEDPDDIIGCSIAKSNDFSLILLIFFLIVFFFKRKIYLIY